MCPWCYIGLRRLKAALQSEPLIDAHLRFVPFVFDPETPDPPLDWVAYVALRYPERMQSIYNEKLPRTLLEASAQACTAGLQERAALRDPDSCTGPRLVQAASVGLAFKDYEKRLVSQTVDALSLLYVARPLGVEEALVDQIFHRHFCGGQDTGDHAVLEACAEAAGVSLRSIGLQSQNSCSQTPPRPAT